ncbi:MAG: hypothetical protein GY711_34950 [bacterium]|nr:hypothetical protein [bacterium]
MHCTRVKRDRRFRSLLVALLAACFVSSCGGGGGASSGSSEGATGPLTANFKFLSTYSPLDGHRTRFWKRHYTDTAGVLDFDVRLSGRAARGGEELHWLVGEESTAERNVHWTTSTPQSWTLDEGQDSVSIRIELLPRGVFFSEKRLQLQLVASNRVAVDRERATIEVWIRPTAPPPTVDIVPGHTNVSLPGEPVLVDFQLSAASDEDVELHFVVEGPLGGHLFHAGSGSVVIPAGQASGQVAMSYDGQAAPETRARVVPDYERNSVVRQVELDDGSLQDIHVDENLWTFSEGLCIGLEDEQASPFLPAFPTNLIAGGVLSDGPGPIARLVAQATAEPRLNPFTQRPLLAVTPTDVAEGFPYVRSSFYNASCNGSSQLTVLGEWVRTSYYIDRFHGVDAELNTTFHHVGLRVRTEDLNHGVVFRSDSAGFDMEGNPVPVVHTPVGDFGLWKSIAPHPTDAQWGVFEDEVGVGIYFVHRLDPSIVWPRGEIEQPGVDRGNALHFTTWWLAGDGSEVQGTLAEMRGRGTLSYGFWFESGSEPLSGPPERVWPKFGNWWEPRGNAAMPAEPAVHTIEAQ